MKEEQIKEYEAHLRRLNEMAKELGVEFTYMDSHGAIVVSNRDASVLESLIIANMLRQDIFAKAVLGAVGFFFEHKEDMKDVVARIRESDASNVAKEMVDKLLKDNVFK